jgi:hypothetical protein
MPVVRRGITATPAYLEFEGKKQFLVDAPIYHGSSGSPVFLFNRGAWMDERRGNIALSLRLKFLGVVYGAEMQNTPGPITFAPIPTQMRPMATTEVPMNLGVCLFASRMLDFEPEFVRRGFVPPDGYQMRAVPVP